MKSDFSQEESDLPLDLLQRSLGQILLSVEAIIHPSLYERVLRQAGVRLGQEVGGQAAGQAASATETYVRCLEGLRDQWGWQCRTERATDDAITFQVARCPFGALAAETRAFCQIESGLIGGLAGEVFGTSKVVMEPGAGSPPQNCRITVYHKKSEASISAEGRMYPEEADALSDSLQASRRQSLLGSLSHREGQVLRLVGEGLSNKEIACTLDLSVRTVEGHIKRLRAKLGLKGRHELIRLTLHSKLST